MKTFKQFLSEAKIDAPHGLFARMTPTLESTLVLNEFFKDLGTLQSDPHCTLIYSKTPANNVDLPFVPKDQRFLAQGINLEFWPGHDQEGYIVLKLISEDLQKLNQRFQTAGIVPTFPEYKPHVTLVHPVPDRESYLSMVNLLNKQLSRETLTLEFYYAGYVILEGEEL